MVSARSNADGTLVCGTCKKLMEMDAFHTKAMCTARHGHQSFLKICAEGDIQNAKFLMMSQSSVAPGGFLLTVETLNSGLWAAAHGGHARLIRWILRQKGMARGKILSSPDINCEIPSPTWMESDGICQVGIQRHQLRESQVPDSALARWYLQSCPTQSPLLAAALQMKDEAVQVLLEHGARIDLPSIQSTFFIGNVLLAEDRNHLLHLFVTVGGLDVDATLTCFDALCPDPQGTTLLINAVGLVDKEKRHLETVRTLVVELGADVNKSNANGATPMFLAAQGDALEAAEILAAAGADVHRVKNSGASPLVSFLCSTRLCGNNTNLCAI